MKKNRVRKSMVFFPQNQSTPRVVAFGTDAIPKEAELPRNKRAKRHHIPVRNVQFCRNVYEYQKWESFNLQESTIDFTMTGEPWPKELQDKKWDYHMATSITKGQLSRVCSYFNIDLQDVETFPPCDAKDGLISENRTWLTRSSKEAFSPN